MAAVLHAPPLVLVQTTVAALAVRVKAREMKRRFRKVVFMIILKTCVTVPS